MRDIVAGPWVVACHLVAAFAVVVVDFPDVVAALGQMEAEIEVVLGAGAVGFVAVVVDQVVAVRVVAGLVAVVVAPVAVVVAPVAGIAAVDAVDRVLDVS